VFVKSTKIPSKADFSVTNNGFLDADVTKFSNPDRIGTFRPSCKKLHASRLNTGRR